MRIEKIVRNPFLFKLFLFLKLPLAFFAGVRLDESNHQSSTVSLKSGWRSNNPFKSMYFAAQCMAAELATGVTLLQALEHFRKNASTLVVSLHSNYHLKAAGRITFRADWNSTQLRQLESLQPGESKTFTLEVNAINREKEVVSDFEIVWSVKIRN